MHHVAPGCDVLALGLIGDDGFCDQLLDKFGLANKIVMNLCRRSTKEPQLVAFQLKIIHNIVNSASNR